MPVAPTNANALGTAWESVLPCLFFPLSLWLLALDLIFEGSAGLPVATADVAARGRMVCSDIELSESDSSRGWWVW